MTDFFSVVKAPSKITPAIHIDDFLNKMHGPPNSGLHMLNGKMDVKTRILTIDVRAPIEYAKGHIPGAINVPLFDDTERAVVGTKYKKKGRYEAIKSGLTFIGPKLPSFLSAIEKHGLKPGDSILVYCWRGGMRSGAISWLLSLCDYKVAKLDGGYRSYRRWCKQMISHENSLAPSSVYVLGGYTGSGKTAILNELSIRGEQFLDLEGFANHRGSAFGWIGQEEQPSNETYENLLAMAVRRVSSKKPLWIEHEGQHVGTCSIPIGIQKWVLTTPNNGRMYVLDMSKELRGSRLVNDYCSDKDVQNNNSWVEGLKQCISLKKGGLAKRLGGARVKEAVALLENGRYHEVAIMMLDYYDKLYKSWVEVSQSKSVEYISCSDLDEKKNADLLLMNSSTLHSSSTNYNLMTIVDNGDVNKDDCNNFDNSNNGNNNRNSHTNTGNASTKEDSQNTKNSSIISPDSSKDVPVFKGKCYCGEVEIEAHGAPHSVSYCHCSICRKLSGAPFSCQALFKPDQVKVTLAAAGNISALATSKAVDRYRCVTCFSPIKASVLGGKVIAVPLQLITSWVVGSSNLNIENELLRPRHHLYYSDRVMDVLDELPKYSHGARANAKQFNNTNANMKQNNSNNKRKKM